MSYLKERMGKNELYLRNTAIQKAISATSDNQGAEKLVASSNTEILTLAAIHEFAAASSMVF
jgi:hypothetical protein